MINLPHSVTRLFNDAGHRFLKMSRNSRIAVVAAIVVPITFAAIVGDPNDESSVPANTAVATAAAANSAVANNPTAGSGSFLHGAGDVLSHDLDQVLSDISEAGPAAGAAAVDPEFAARAVELMEKLPKDADGNPDWENIDMAEYQRQIAALGDPQGDGTQVAEPVEFDELDLDEALEIIADRIDAANPDTLDDIRDSAQAEQPRLLIAHSMTLMSLEDIWGAAANLLVAHEEDNEDATPLINLAAIANSQNLPAVALALLDAADELDIGDDDSPAGIAERATQLNNRGHALLLVHQYEEAEEPLRAALALSPELSEAARNLAHALVKLGREEEARELVPRAVWRLRGNPAQPVPVREQTTTPPDEPPPATGSPEQIAVWVAQPYLELSQGSVQLPLAIALDLSRQGQVAWPEPLYPVADDTYGGWFERASARYVASNEAARAFGEQTAEPYRTMASRPFTIADLIHQAIEVKISPQWALEPIDTEMHRLQGDKESLILSAPQETRFQSLDVAQAEYRMEEAADRLYERYRRESMCDAGSTLQQCCAIERREINRNITEMMPLARDYEDEMRVFFRDAYGLSTALASNLPSGPWHDAARSIIEQQVQQLVGHTQQELAFAFAHAAPSGGGCYGQVFPAEEEAPEVKVDAPACTPASQWASGKYALSQSFSMEITCGKLKFVAEVNVIGTKKLKWGPLNDIGADLGMHAEVEFSMEGTVTLFAGPKAGVSGKLGEFGGDFGVKDGIYAVIGKDGVKDVGMRVVLGGGVAGGALGGTHDVDSMDFSFASAI